MAGYQGTSTRRDGHEAFAAAIEAERRQVITEIPAEVVSYDRTKQIATVQPKLQQTFGDKVMKAPELQEIPVDHIRGGGFILHKDLKKGDAVTLRIPHRSQEDYNAEGSEVSGAPGRMFNLADARASVGGHPTSKPAQNMPAGTYLGTEDGKNGLTISTSGKVDFKQEGDSIKAVLHDFLVAFRDHLQPDPHDKIGQANALIARVDNLMV